MPSQKEEKTKGIVTGRVGEAAAGPGGKNYLLVIGIDEYAYCPPLYNCVKDAQEVIELLSSEYPFSIDYDEFPPLFNTQATKENITDAFRRLAMKVTQEDNVLIYFSGHGHYDRVFQQGYWVPVEAAEEKITGYIPNSEVRVFLNAIKSRHTFLMADSCFSGALFMDKSAGKVISRRSERDPSRWGLTSGRNEIVSDGEPGKNSPFAESLLYRLRNNTGHLGVDELCAHVKEHVEANSNQTPIGEPLKVEGHKNGLFVFHRLPKETNDWERALSVNTPEAYAQFLEKHPTSPHAEEAWWQRAALLTTSQAYEDYLDRFASGKYAKTAREALAKQEEEEIWEEAQRRDVRSAFYDYLGKFPKGKYREQAQKRIEALRSRHESTAQPVIPKPVVVVPTQTASPTWPEGMILVPAGTFEMGDVMGDKEYDWELPVHSVTLDAFYLGKTPITLEEFSAFIAATGHQTDADKDGGSYLWNGSTWEKKNGVNWKCDTEGKIRSDSDKLHPVIHVSWNDAAEYCNWLSQQKGLQPVYARTKDGMGANWAAKGYRLPTEAEWEYAAREGGKKVRFGNGKDIADPSQMNFDASASYKKPYSVAGKYRQKTVAVGSLNSPNALGLHDMSGNVWEWCWDWFDEEYYKTSPSSNPKGPSSGSYRVLRGGSWSDFPRYCRVADRFSYTPGFRDYYTGFRLARTF